MQKEKLLKILTCIDLTSLGESDSQQSILELIQTANRGYQDHYPAAICVYPQFSDLISDYLNEDIKKAVVGISFPTGIADKTEKMAHYQKVNKSKIDELDIVVSTTHAFEDHWGDYGEEVELARKTIGSKTLKVIIESGELDSTEKIIRASEIAIANGADFVKTSTGKTSVGCTDDALIAICGVLKKHFQETGKKIGIKASGGIRSVEDAINVYDIVSEQLGEEWIERETFRIGASKLYGHIIEALNG